MTLASARRAPRLSATPAPDALFGRWAAATAAAAFLLLYAGGMVTSTGSGLAVPDWPLSFGTLFPRMTGGVFFEHGHRLVAGAVALMSLALAVLSSRAGVPAESRGACRWAAGLILVQALLGGLTVLLRLPPAVSIAHACLGQAVFCLLFAAALAASRGHQALGREAAARRTALLAAAAFGAAFLQLALGALVRHTGAGLPWHLAWALGVLLLAAAAVFTALRSGPPALRGAALAVAASVPLQLALGLLAFRIRADSALVIGFREAALWRTAHQAGGAVVLASLLALALRARRLAR